MVVEGKSGLKLDGDLVPFLEPVGSRGRGAPRILLDIAGVLPSIDQLRRAIEAGLILQLDNTSSGGAFSLGYLEPVIGLVRTLRIAVTGITLTDVDILERADRLEELEWLYPASIAPVDLSHLSRLRTFSALFIPELSSVLANKSLKKLGIYGTKLGSLPEITAPLSDLVVGDRRLTDRLPQLRHPELLRSFRVDMPRRFDAASLLAAPNLEEAQLNGVSQLENVAALAGLSKLTRLEVEGASQEDWDVLLDCSPTSARFILSPSPSKRLRDEGARRGWVVAGKHDQRSDRLAPFDLLAPSDEGGGPVLHLDDFAALTELIAAILGKEGFDEGAVNGHLAEDLVRAACEADPELSTAVIEFDSEAEGMYAAFPTKKLALRAVKATMALIRDASTLRTLFGQ